MASDEFALECFAPLDTPSVKLTHWPAAGRWGNRRCILVRARYSTMVIARTCRFCEEVFQVFAGGSGLIDIPVEIRIAGANEKGRR
jgi:hypothetical protein